MSRWTAAHLGTRIAALSVAAVFSAGVMWSAVTPLGGVPDERAHIVYAAGVVRGDLGNAAPVDLPYYDHLAVVSVPEWIASISTCYAFDTSITADCAPPVGTSMALTDLTTTATRYPPLYHSIVGVPTLITSGAGTVYTMRALSAALAALLIGIGLLVATPDRRGYLSLGALVGFTPMAAHLAGSINPSGLEVAAALGLAVALLGVAGGPGGVRTAALVLALTTVLAWSRPLSFVTLGGVVLVGAVANGMNLRRWLRQRFVGVLVIGGTAAAVLSATAFELFVREPVSRQIRAGAVGAPANEFVGIVENLRSVERMFVSWSFDLVGRFGWLDHSPPAIVQVGWLALASALVVFGFAVGTKRDRLALSATAAGALVIAPLFVMQFLFGSVKGYQARYHLPLAAVAVLVAATVISTSASVDLRRSGWSILRWGSLITAIGMLLSVAASMYRYAIGGSPNLADLMPTRFLTQTEWMSGKVSIVLALGALAAGAAAITTFALSRREPISSDTWQRSIRGET